MRHYPGLYGSDLLPNHCRPVVDLWPVYAESGCCHAVPVPRNRDRERLHWRDFPVRRRSVVFVLYRIHPVPTGLRCHGLVVFPCRPVGQCCSEVHDPDGCFQGPGSGCCYRDRPADCPGICKSARSDSSELFLPVHWRSGSECLFVLRLLSHPVVAVGRNCRVPCFFPAALYVLRRAGFGWNRFALHVWTVWDYNPVFARKRRCSRALKGVCANGGSDSTREHRVQVPR